MATAFDYEDTASTSELYTSLSDTLPDILSSHVPPDYEYIPASGTLRMQRSGSGSRFGNNFRLSSIHPLPPEIIDTNRRAKECSDCCLRCFVVVTRLRWILVFIALLGAISVIVGIIFGVLNITLGSSFLTLSLTFIGLGVLLVLVVGVGWRCSPPEHEPCHALCRLGDYTSDSLADPGRGTSRMNLHGRNQWFGGMLYPEFQYTAPPPSYNLSMQISRNQSVNTHPRGGQPSGRQSSINNSLDDISLPSSPPPTYRSGIIPVIPALEETGVIPSTTRHQQQRHLPLYIHHPSSNVSSAIESSGASTVFPPSLPPSLPSTLPPSLTLSGMPPSFSSTIPPPSLPTHLQTSSTPSTQPSFSSSSSSSASASSSLPNDSSAVFADVEDLILVDQQDLPPLTIRHPTSGVPRDLPARLPSVRNMVKRFESLKCEPDDVFTVQRTSSDYTVMRDPASAKSQSSLTSRAAEASGAGDTASRSGEGPSAGDESCADGAVARGTTMGHPFDSDPYKMADELSSKTDDVQINDVSTFACDVTTDRSQSQAKSNATDQSHISILNSTNQTSITQRLSGNVSGFSDS